MPKIFGLLLTFLLLASMAACGGDDEVDIEAFCDRVATVEESEGEPSEDQLDALVDAAPDAIADEVETLVDGLREFTEEADITPDFEEAGNRFDAYVESNCPDA